MEVGSSVDRISEMLVVCEILVTIFVVRKKSNEKEIISLAINVHLFITASKWSF